ncbi:MAG TPA: hypothetical protein VD835_18250 [Pyrinomonadaceae bacterium]|nr:hypothetical protein [Pyrinomonadaceae bacterium]
MHAVKCATFRLPALASLTHLMAVAVYNHQASLFPAPESVSGGRHAAAAGKTFIGACRMLVFEIHLQLNYRNIIEGWACKSTRVLSLQ